MTQPIIRKVSYLYKWTPLGEWNQEDQAHAEGEPQIIKGELEMVWNAKKRAWFIEGAGWWNAIAILRKGRYFNQYEWHCEEYYKLQHKRADKFLLYVLSVCHDLIKRDALYKGAFSACVGQPVFGIDDEVVKVDDVIAPPGGDSE